MIEPAATDLLNRIASSRAEVRAEAAATFADWRGTIANPGFVAAAEKLAAYLAPRRHDLGDPRPALTARGLSSLGRGEAHLLASLDALCATLARIAGLPGYDYPPPAVARAGGRDPSAARDGRSPARDSA